MESIGLSYKYIMEQITENNAYKGDVLIYFFYVLNHFFFIAQGFISKL